MNRSGSQQWNQPVKVLPWNLVWNGPETEPLRAAVSAPCSREMTVDLVQGQRKPHDSDWVLLNRGHNCSKQNIAKGSSKTFWLITHWLMTCKTNIYELVLQDVVRMFRRKEIARFPFDAIGWEAAYEKEIELREDFSRYNCWGLYLKERE